MKSSQGEEIGTIKDVVIDRNTGCMAYTVLSTGGGGGRVAGGGGKMVAVPWSVYSPQSDLNMYTVTVERERIFTRRSSITLGSKNILGRTTSTTFTAIMA